MRRRLQDDRDENTPKSDTYRIEALSDGVFAIAITLLVLEIHIPHLVNAAPGSLRNDLVALWPAYFAYIFSFITVGIYWANHHYIFRLYKHTDHVFNLLNVLFLMCIAFVPLPTAILGEYVRDPAQRHTAVVFYNLGLTLPAVAWALCWFYAAKNHRLIDRRLDPKFVDMLTRQYLLSFVLYGMSMGAAVWSSTLGLIIAMSITGFYLLPPAMPVYREVEGEA